jgi:hypothetical protein
MDCKYWYLCLTDLSSGDMFAILVTSVKRFGSESFSNRMAKKWIETVSYFVIVHLFLHILWFSNNPYKIKLLVEKSNTQKAPYSACVQKAERADRESMKYLKLLKFVFLVVMEFN